MKLFFFILTLSIWFGNTSAMAQESFELQPFQTKECILLANTDVGQKKIANGNCKDLNTYDYKNPFWFANEKIAEITANCGTECAYSYFVNFKTGTVSSNYYLVTILDQKQQIILYPGNDEQGKSLVVSHIFKDKKSGEILIQRNFSSSSATDINKIQLDDNYILLLSYIAGKNYQDITENIKIDLGKLNSGKCWEVSIKGEYTECRKSP